MSGRRGSAPRYAGRPRASKSRTDRAAETGGRWPAQNRGGRAGSETGQDRRHTEIEKRTESNSLRPTSEAEREGMSEAVR